MKQTVVVLAVCVGLFSSSVVLARGSIYTAETYDMNVSLQKTDRYRVLSGPMRGVVLYTKGCPEFSVNESATLYVYSVNDMVLKFFGSSQECQVTELERNVNKDESEITIKRED